MRGERVQAQRYKSEKYVLARPPGCGRGDFDAYQITRDGVKSGIVNSVDEIRSDLSG